MTRNPSNEFSVPAEGDSLHEFMRRLSSAKALRDGDIVLRMTGADGGNFCLRAMAGDVRAVAAPPNGTPRAELIGNARNLRAVLNGTKDARALFVAGGFRVRGDIRYVSDLGQALGILRTAI